MKKLTVTVILITLFAFKLADIRSIYHIPMQANAVCATDYDLDGDLDIVVKHSINSQTQWGGIYMLQNDGYGHFIYLDSIYDTTGIWTVYADTVLSKTYPDIIYHPNDNITILSTDGENYTRSHFYIGTHINDFDLGDVDNNGHLDVVFISNNNHYWGIIYNNGDSSFTAPEYYTLDHAPTDIACKDLNGDGRADVVKTGASSEIYFSNDTGFEMQPLKHGASYVKIADLDNDGDNDITIVGDAYIMSFVHLYENLGNNIFDTVNNFNIPEGCSKFFVTDFNNDSLPDALFMTYDTSEDLLLYYNKGNFQFSLEKVIDLDYYGEARRFMHCADMDGNGYNDIIITRQVYYISYAPSYLEILFNDGHGNFVENPLTGIPTTDIKHQTLNLNCYPNPFSDWVTIKFTLEKECQTELIINGLNGQKIKTIENKKLQKGKYTHTWDGTDNNGKEVSSCFYIVSLVAGRRKQQYRIVYAN